MVTERKLPVWERDKSQRNDIEYIRFLHKRAAPDKDAAMIVDWIPFIPSLCDEIEDLRREYADLREDYENLKTERMKAVWKKS